MRTLMLVSANAGGQLRREVQAGARPMPEFMVLERDYGVRLLDWSRLAITPGRSPERSIRHVAAAVRMAADADTVFSDGEHLGIPLGIALHALGPTRPHLMLGHHLTSRSKPLVLRFLRHMGISRVLVHSRAQLKVAIETLGFTDGSAAFIPYYADARFWLPQGVQSTKLVVSAGLEHRDYETLVSAVEPLPVRTVIAAASQHSPAARCRMPASVPFNVSFVVRDAVELRDLYAHADIVVVPLVPNDFQAGVTTILEAMAMAKPVIVSGTHGQRDVVVHGETGVIVPPHDVAALRDEIRRLLDHAGERQRLGANARDAILARYDLPIYAATLHRHLVEISRPLRRAA